MYFKENTGYSTLKYYKAKSRNLLMWFKLYKAKENCKTEKKKIIETERILVKK